MSKYCHDVPTDEKLNTHKTIENIGLYGVFAEK